MISTTISSTLGNIVAVDILRWPGMNQAFIFSFVVTTALSLAIIPYGKRRPVGRTTTWGEAMVGATFIFFVLFLAFGVVPDRFIRHADNELGWRSDQIVFGPFDILKPQALGGSINPITISYEAVRDIVVVVIHVFYIGLYIWLAVWWQKRGQVAAKAKELETSTYGRPLVKKG